MAFIECNFFSESLRIETSMSVILPESSKELIGMESATSIKEPPVLYLLHGLSDNHTIWSRRTSIERYVAPLGIAVVMPEVNRSFYTDMSHGAKYWTFISEELPRKVNQMFNVSSKREDTFVAGLSMGGYGAMKLALRCPDKFAAAASLSGAVDLEWQSSNKGLSKDAQREYSDIFGDLSKFHESDDNLIHLLHKGSKDVKNMPKLYQCCGTEDYLYESNQSFRKTALELGYDLTYEEDHGVHEWKFWDNKIQNVLKWLPTKK